MYTLARSPLRIRLGAGGGRRFSPLNLFQNGQTGLYLDFANNAHFFSDPNGTTAAGHDDVIGLALDSSQGGLGNLGANVLDSPTGPWDEAPWTSVDISISGNEITITDNSGRIWQSLHSGPQSILAAANANTFWRFARTIRHISGNPLIRHRVLMSGNRNDTVDLFPAAELAEQSRIFHLTAADIPGSSDFLNMVVLGASLNGHGTVELTHTAFQKIPGHHAHQPTAASRPRREQDGDLWFARFDGSNDFLTAPGLVLSQPFTYIIATSIEGGSGVPRIVEAVGAVSAGRINYDPSEGRLVLFSGSALNGPVLGATPIPAMIITGVFNGANSWISVNGGARISGDAGSLGITEGINIAANRTGTGNMLEGKNYGMVIRSGILTDSEIAATEHFLAQKAGIDSVLLTSWDLNALFTEGQTGLLALPTPHSDYPQYTTHTGSTEASVDDTVGLVIDRSQDGMGNLGPELLSNSEFNEDSPGQTAWTLSPAETTISGGLARLVTTAEPDQERGIITQQLISNSPGHQFLRFQGSIVYVEALTRFTFSTFSGLSSNLLLGTNRNTPMDEHAIVHISPGQDVHCNIYNNLATDGNEAHWAYARTRRIPGHHAHQPTEASRPLLKNEGGLRYWEFDGTDDFLSVPGLVLNQPATVILAVRIENNAADQMFIDRLNPVNSGLRVGYFSSLNTIRLFSGVSLGTFTPPTFPFTGVITAIFNGADSRIRINQGSWDVGDGGDRVANTGLHIGALHSGASGFYHGRMYGGLIRSGNLFTDDPINLDRAERVLASRAGLIL